MKLQKVLKFSVVVLFVVLFFSGAIFLSAYYAQFVVDVPSVGATLGVGETSSTDFNISVSPDFSDVEDAEYKIQPHSICNGDQYDADGNCLDPVPDLCQYIELTPQDGESTETPMHRGIFSGQALGQLNTINDQNDKWNLEIKSPCFEGECPANYDPLTNGLPLPQSMKGATFKCNFEVQSNFIVSVMNYFKDNVAYASNNMVEVSAVLTGEVKGCTENCFSNVLFLPGLESSRLYQHKTILGVPVEDQLWEPNTNSDAEDLYLNTDGTSKNPDVYTRDIIKESNTPISTGPAGANIYKSFTQMMDGLVNDTAINAWIPYAYDWRQSVEDIVNNGTKYEDGQKSLMDTLQDLVASSKNGKVTIVAHSNGGLLAKALLKKLQDDKDAGRNNLIDSVDKLILVAVPEIGTAKAVPAILHGYDQGLGLGLLIDDVRARELGRNMLGGFGLLPSKEYINHVSASPTTFVDTNPISNVTTQMVQAYGSAINSYTEYKNFLFGGEGRMNPTIDKINLPINLSQSLFAKAESLHDSIDNWTPPMSIRVIEVAGWGMPTVASMEYTPEFNYCPNSTSGCSKYFLDEVPRFTVDGDGTVVVPSAQYMNFQGNAEKYWVDLPTHNSQLFLGLRRNRQHADILEVASLNNLIKSVIQDENISLDNVLKDTEPVDTQNRFRISIHSPVTIDAYDNAGNHTGKVCPSNSDFCYKEENIPNSSFLEFGEGKYINLSEEDFKTIKLQGTDVGTFTYDSEKVAPDGTSVVSSFVDIPVTTQTQAEITLNPTTHSPQLKLDVTGDGVIDFTIAPNTNFDPVAYLQIMKATIDSLDLTKDQKKNFDKRVDDLIKLIQKGKINKVKLQADKFKSFLQKKLSKGDEEHPKIKKISKTDAQLLLDMLNKLLDNIS